MPTQILPIIALNVANGVAFCDLLAISAVAPIVADLFAPSISWAPTAQLIGATVGQCILGYLSDVWSRRTMLLFAVCLLFASSLATAMIILPQFSSKKLSILFVILRAISGIAIGSISNLVNIAQSDISTKEQRLKLQGVQGISVAAGSILGVMVGAVSAQQHRIYQLFFMEVGLTVLAFCLIAAFFRPPWRLSQAQNFRSAAKTIDYAGILLGIGFIVPLLILITHSKDFAVATQVVLSTLTGLSFLLYIILYAKNPLHCRPIINFTLFKICTLAAIYLQNCMIGMAYYTFIYFLPVYLTVVRDFSAVRASALMIPYFVVHGAWSAGSAQLILFLQKRGHKSYSTVLLQGFATWLGAAVIIALGASYDNIIPVWCVMLMTATIGFGTGAVFQNSVLAVREHVECEGFAVALGVRNVLRYLGGAMGTAISSVIMSSTLTKMVPKEMEQYRVHTINARLLDDLKVDDQDLVRHAFASGITWVFTTSAVLLFICVIGCYWVREGPKEDKDVEL